MNQARPGRRRNALQTFGLVMAVCLIAGGVAGGVAGASEGAGIMGQIATAVVVIMALSLAFGACLWWWWQLDEAAREAHKWAWWWGGSAGMMVGGAVLISLVISARQGALPAALVEMDAVDLLYTGVMGTLVCQMAGYALAWAAWWLQRR